MSSTEWAVLQVRLEKRRRAIGRMTKEQRAALDEAHHQLGEYVVLYNDTKAALDAALAREARLREAAQDVVAYWSDPPGGWTTDEHEQVVAMANLRATLAETPEDETKGIEGYDYETEGLGGT